MRGFPLFNLLAVAVLLALLAIPLLRISAPGTHSLPPLPLSPGALRPAAPALPTTVLLRFVHLPRSASLFANGAEQPLQGEGLERQATLPLREGALEVEVNATWPADTGPTLIEIRAAPEGRPEQLQNLWSEAPELSEWLRFTWKSPP